ncbi:DNA-binding MarR family transcriptional regulator [Natranaerovirga hydrolytica]|uniref:DNA-binding MarR family transcriptional regulator n=1 Tax=Natranaerovirga hydrolytica TaxID=680378 RepID=A0A4V2Q1I2_9FIRM|nr:MarR family transcriptional regulator [Natranaerovirga hydrolytica]TCK97721.1 DNA-binding MarR family transcriptional regulator [Natranaerovirga hydrolytica]
MNYNREDSLNFLLTKVIKLRRKKLHTLLSEIDMHPGQHAILYLLWEEDGQTQKALCTKVMIKPSSTTVVLQRMEKNGLVTREMDLEDKRISRVYLTDKGKAIKPMVDQTLKTMEEKCYKDFNEKDLEAFKSFLKRIEKNLEDE